ncbi:phosphatase PAP2 family protein [Candidatus Acidulodesulfobacterium sp. H_13]|uniref:phosphatase PAP2 family protein n=1 Tax=Candidatus Acidulodesulfobacterium sp. H_13 TaxID=3395470 RepID=UPI003AF96EB4
MKAVTFLGNGWVAYWIILVFIYIYNRSKFKESFFLLFLTQIVPGIFDITIKRLVSRPRPIVALHSLIEAGTVHVNLLGRHLTEHSFPSGHATTAFSLSVALSYIFPKHRKLFYALAFIVAFSRVYNGEHYPLDVVAGGILGYTLAKITLVLYKRIKKINGYNFE